MKVVIDIPDEWKTRIECNRRPNTIECGELVESIWKGEILPKGYGRLIDADDVNKHIVGFVDLRDCPTIIEADKEDEQ